MSNKRGIRKRKYYREFTPADRELVLDFLLAFSRLEYALKRAGYFYGDGRRADVDWKKFAEVAAGRFESSSSDSLKVSIRYFSENPPRKQIVDAKGELAWATPKQNPGEALEPWVLSLLRIVRNNLFHGGKFPTLGSVPEYARDHRLLTAGLDVIDACLELDDSFSHFFDEAA